MVIVSGYSFEGPYEIGKQVVDKAAVYVILDKDDKVVDVGQSGETGTRLSTHNRKPCWDKYDGKWFAVKWMPSDEYSEEDRKKVEGEIRDDKTPPCGEI